MKKKPTKKSTKAVGKVRTVKAWAEVGMHGGIYEFLIGPVGDAYPGLLHVFIRKTAKNLVPVTITYRV